MAMDVEGYAKSQTALLKIADAIARYGTEHRYAFPKDFAELCRKGFLQPHDVISPRIKGDLPQPPPANATDDARDQYVNAISHYVYAPPAGKKVLELSSDDILIYENPNRVRDAVNVLRGLVEADALSLSGVTIVNGRMYIKGLEPK